MPNRGAEGLAIVEEDGPLETAYEVTPRGWGTDSGASADEVTVGGANGSTLYLAFDLRPGQIESAVLELRPSEDTTYGPAQSVEVWAVESFDAIDTGRLPGARSRAIARRTVWQPRLRFDVTEMVQGRPGAVHLAIRARGTAPGWRLATTGAGNPQHRPRLVVHEAVAAE